ncbi:transglutaminase domain-containing protein [Paenibacillus albicereus]|uniref:Transglutaminase domain-containing protein n=2 Tax=Paenibacillus albicereus TaxID=2726185 RepID=A0A6H2H472_9BACL|nr:transglutaminase domain-containing protein [Paenibacillus albicereus]
MSGAGQAFCLLLGLSILLSALQTLVWIRQWGIGLLGLTAGYLWLLSEWFGIDTMPNLARAAAEGVLLGALLSLHRLKRRQSDAWTAGTASALPDGAEMPPWRWWAASGGAAALLALGAAGLSAGKPAAEQPAGWALKAQQAIRASASQDGAGTVRRSPIFSGEGGTPAAEGGTAGTAAETGYGRDDTLLGAPLRQSGRTLFWAVSPEPLYWRMEAKTVYTGQGWREEGAELVSRAVGPAAAASGKAVVAGDGAERTGTESESSARADAEPASSGAADTGRPSKERQRMEPEVAETIRQSVWLPRLEEGMPLPAAGRAASILSARSPGADTSAEWTSYLSETGGGAVYLPQAAGGALGYTVLSELVRPTEEQMRLGAAAGAAASGAQAEPTADTTDGQLELELKAALQLPASLPQRVKELAVAATAGKEDRYGQVAAVRDYLKANYRYSLTETAAPAPGQDLVDQFLFERKVGYCVHFSTAMAVLLRSVGIPARWVKGFAPGEALASGKAPAEARAALGGAAAGAGGELYRVSGLDAHAWVEVYFPGAGWVAIDPTPGYAAGAAQQPEIPAAADAEGAAAAPSPAPQQDAAASSRLREAAGAAAGRAAELARALAQPGPAAAVAALGALAAALASPGLRTRLRLALALRRYALAAAGGERRSRRAAQRAALLAAAEAQLRALERRQGAAPLLGGGPAERAEALAPRLAPAAAAALRRLAAWAEAARFAAPATWRGPAAAELAAAMALVRRDRA